MTPGPRMRAITTAAVVVGAVATVLAPTAASADARVVLPEQVKTMRMGDGTVVTMKRTRERALVNSPIASTPLHRSVWVSGRYEIKLSRTADQVKVRPGYIVGCQGYFGNLQGTLNGADSDLGNFNGIDDVGVGATVVLAPGQAAFFNLTDAEREDDFHVERHEPYYRLKKTDHAKYVYKNAQLGISGCIGYAQARSWMRLAVETQYATQFLDFFGRPFSIG
ncbi:MspA family porin [Gordonia sp. (in: high G+C Gram-positive bacteria)]|uniref:MspA family porin n=1 Tax=Gordonia sp. (in: high G+C Gram-positive bacteria) TaxID=84139 RepID=UPI0039E71C96